MKTTRIDLSTLSIILLCQIYMDAATRQGTKNRICWDARTERIQNKELGKNE